MKHILTLTTLSAAALLAVAACSKTGSEPANPNAGKELISFSGEGGAATKVGFTTTTCVKMRVKAEAAGKASVREVKEEIECARDAGADVLGYVLL